MTKKLFLAKNLKINSSEFRIPLFLYVQQPTTSLLESTQLYLEREHMKCFQLLDQNVNSHVSYNIKCFLRASPFTAARERHTQIPECMHAHTHMYVYKIHVQITLTRSADV